MHIDLISLYLKYIKWSYHKMIRNRLKWNTKDDRIKEHTKLVNSVKECESTECIKGTSVW